MGHSGAFWGHVRMLYVNLDESTRFTVVSSFISLFAQYSCNLHASLFVFFSPGIKTCAFRGLGVGELSCSCYRVFILQDDGWWGWLHGSVNVLDAADLYA